LTDRDCDGQEYDEGDQMFGLFNSESRGGMVAAVVGLATAWGRAEALTAAIVGGLGYDYR